MTCSDFLSYFEMKIKNYDKLNLREAGKETRNRGKMRVRGSFELNLVQKRNKVSLKK